MLAIMSTPQSAEQKRFAASSVPVPTGVPAATRRVHLQIVGDCGSDLNAAPIAQRIQRPSAATFTRRRIAVVVGIALAVFMMGRVGAALGSSSPFASERRPSVVKHLVAPGDTLWTVANKIAPHEDPRLVVDALADVRGTSPLMPGEVLSWQH